MSIELDQLQNRLDFRTNRVEGIKNKSAQLGTPEGPAWLNYVEALNPADRIKRITRVSEIRDLILDEKVPFLEGKLVETQTDLENEQYKELVREDVRVEFGIEALEEKHKSGRLTDFDYQTAIEAMEEEVRNRVKELYTPAENPMQLDETMHGSIMWHDLDMGPRPEGREAQTVYKVVFAGGEVFETTDEKAFKFTQKINEELRDSRGVEIARGDVVVAVHGRFDRDIAEETERMASTLNPQLEAVGVKVTYVLKPYEEVKDARLRRVFRAEVITPPYRPEVNGEGSRTKENEHLSESEKVLKALDLILKGDVAVSRIVALMSERLDRVFKGPEGVSDVNALAYLVRELDEIYDKLTEGGIVPPQMELWKKIKEAAGQTGEDPDSNFAARNFFKERITKWYEDGKGKPDTSGSSDISGGNEEENQPKRRVRKGGSRENKVVTIGEGTLLVRGKGATEYMEVFVNSLGVALSYQRVAELVGEEEIGNASAQINNVKKVYGDELAELGYEIHTEGTRGAMTVVIRRIGGGVDSAPVPKRPDKRDSDEAQELEAEFRTIIRQYDLLHKSPQMRRGAVVDLVPSLARNLNKIIEKRLIQPKTGQSGTDITLSPEQIAQAVVYDRAIKHGGITQDLERNVRVVTDSAFHKESEALKSRSR